MRVVSPNSDKKVDVKFYCGSATDNGKTVANVGAAWQRVTHTFKWISTSDDRLRFEPINTATEIGATRFEYAAYQLEEGNIVSSYKPSSKDAFTSGAVTLFEIQVLIAVLWIGTTIIQPLKQK